MAKKEFKVGEVFQFGLVKLRVEAETPSKSCSQCNFNLTRLCCNTDDYTGGCFAFDREDKTDVIFVKVED